MLIFLKFQTHIAKRNPRAPGLSTEELQLSGERLVEAVPSSITTLCFADIEDVTGCQLLDAALSYLLECKNEEFPRLQRITMSFEQNKAQDIAKAMSQSLNLAKSIGITLEFTAQKLVAWQTFTLIVGD